MLHTLRLSMSVLARVSCEVLLVNMIELCGLLDHCRKRSREKPHSKSGGLTSTAYERKRERDLCRNQEKNTN